MTESGSFLQDEGGKQTGLEDRSWLTSTAEFKFQVLAAPGQSEESDVQLGGGEEQKAMQEKLTQLL